MEELYVLTVTDDLDELDEALHEAADASLGHVERLERWAVTYVDFCLRYVSSAKTSHAPASPSRSPPPARRGDHCAPELARSSR